LDIVECSYAKTVFWYKKYLITLDAARYRRVL
jgi:hypothetical protein